MNGIIEPKKFYQINLNDPFFETLKEDYPEFEQWFKKKGDEIAQVFYNESDTLEAFLYMKTEIGPINDVQPILDGGLWLKVGTMKVNPHGTRLGERFIKKILDYAIVKDTLNIYVTVFEKHQKLVETFKKYGFKVSGKKISSAGEELVLTKNLKNTVNNTLQDYPLVISRNKAKHLLAIKPKYHTKLFPDSILKNESFDIISDVSHTNSIHKVYLSSMPGLASVKKGDLLVIYRTKTENTSAWYTSVATSICVIEEVRSPREFSSLELYMKYCKSYSVFNDSELLEYWYKKGRVYIIKMTYNIAFRKRLTRKKLVEEVGLNEKDYWGCISLSDQEFEKILTLGDVYESLVID
ncbi:N-acetyltransferase [Paenibacillus sp. FSL H7-0716]|uniref:N-acetyltransferase n=1 Tax=Paenibacillus odorifer TaxID=189426 RepID=A0AB36JNE0_9BACL|nr:N-acetyltransferase [Paenibacillus odorifer]OME23527.1 N-acetyltransferase [Paenibacillus odorifer]